MSAQSQAVSALRAELARVEAGGDIDRATYIRWLTDAALQLDEWIDAHHEAWSERVDFAKQCTRNEALIAGVGMVCDVIQRACKGETDAAKAVEFARDTAPFRNVMKTMYGLGSCGEELPKRRSRKTKAVHS